MTGVLLTGATTPVGQRLVEALVRRSDVGRVLAVGAEPPDQIPIARADERVIYRRVDLRRGRQVRRLLFGPARELGITTIVHTALHRAARDRGTAIRALNVESTRALLHLAEGHPTIERFVYRSFADVYRTQADLPILIGEDHPLRLHTRMPQYLRDRIEADVTVCTRMGLSPLHIVVLRFAEILEPDSGSQLHDYLSSRICFRPLGFDPMVHLMSAADAVRATVLALSCEARGVFNIPGADVLPLSAAIHGAGRLSIPVPGSMLAPLYNLRARVLRTDFRYDINRPRFHFSGVLDGRRAREHLGYEPSQPIDWPALAASLTQGAS